MLLVCIATTHTQAAQQFFIWSAAHTNSMYFRNTYIVPLLPVRVFRKISRYTLAMQCHGPFVPVRATNTKLFFVLLLGLNLSLESTHSTSLPNSIHSRITFPSFPEYFRKRMYTPATNENLDTDHWTPFQCCLQPCFCNFFFSTYTSTSTLYFKNISARFSCSRPSHVFLFTGKSNLEFYHRVYSQIGSNFVPASFIRLDAMLCTTPRKLSPTSMYRKGFLLLCFCSVSIKDSWVEVGCLVDDRQYPFLTWTILKTLN